MDPLKEIERLKNKKKKLSSQKDKLDNEVLKKNFKKLPKYKQEDINQGVRMSFIQNFKWYF